MLQLLKRIYLILRYVNLKTIRFNLYYFRLNQALLFPVFISKHTTILHLSGSIEIKGNLKPGIVRIGYSNVGIFDKKYCRSIWEVRGKVKFSGRAILGNGTRISVGKNGTLDLGENFEVTASSAIIANKLVRFGNDCIVSWDVMIMDDDFHKITEFNNSENVLNFPKDICFGNHVWIGNRCIVLKGTSIGNNNILSAGSLANKIYEGDNMILAGVPAIKVKSEINWKY